MIKYYLCYTYLLITRLFLSVCQVNCCHYGTEILYNGDIWFCGKIHHMKDKIEVDIWRLNRFTGGIDHKTVDQNTLSIRLTPSNIVHNALWWWRDYIQNYLSDDASYISHKNIPYSYLVLGKRQALGLNYERI